MINIPVSMVPVVGRAVSNRAAVFVLAVIAGFALYLAYRNQKSKPAAQTSVSAKVSPIRSKRQVA